MKGKYNILVQNNKLRYEFTISRNITIIRGDSATGKTTLLELLASFDREGDSSGVEVKCAVPCVVIGGQRWQESLSYIHNSIVFIDECNRFVRSEEFAIAVKNSDNYFVIVTRDDLANLPYSVTEIYGMRVSHKYAGLKQIYNELYQLYGAIPNVKTDHSMLLLAEDSNAGYEFFQNIYKGKYQCFTANGKSNIFKFLQQHKNEAVLVIADGAAFGCEMARIMQLIKLGRMVMIYLPESFEWLILQSGVLDNSEITHILQNPSDYIESNKYFSWERFFTAVLIKESQGTYLQYNKQKLNPQFLQARIVEKIMQATSLEDI